jgi:hypothetical protein
MLAMTVRAVVRCHCEERLATKQSRPAGTSAAWDYFASLAMPPIL